MSPVKHPPLLLLPLLVIGAAACAMQPPAQDWQKFLAWFAGEYDNHEQVWRQRENGAQETVPHRQQMLRKVSMPAIGPRVYLAELQPVQQDMQQGQVQHRLLYALQPESASRRIRAVAYAFDGGQPLPAEPQGISRQALKAVPDCDVLWQSAGDAFSGTVAGEEGCPMPSVRSAGTVCVRARLRLNAEGLHTWSRPCGEAGAEVLHAGRRLRYYQGWMAIQRQRLGLEAPEDDWLFIPEFRIHSEGQTVPLRFEDGRPTGYAVQLAQLTYRRTSQPILKFGLLNQDGDTITYTWSDAGARRIGMNLRWFQAGLSAEEAAE